MRQHGKRVPEYAITMMFQPTDPTIQLLAAMVQQAAAAKWPQGIPADFYTPILDGNKKAAQYPEMAGMFTIKANSKTRKPLVLDRDKNEVMDPSTIYSGAKFRAVVDCFAYDTESNGVAFGLKICQKTADGAPFGGGIADPSLIPALAALPQAAPVAMPGQMMQQPAPVAMMQPQAVQAQPQAMPVQPQMMPQPQPMPQPAPMVQQPVPMQQPQMMPQPAPMVQQPQAMPQAQPMPQQAPQAMPGQPAGGPGFIPSQAGNIDLNNI